MGASHRRQRWLLREILYDHRYISRGISIVSTRKGEFTSGDKFYILDIDGHPTEKKIKLEIKYVLPLEDQQNKYRAGCEFIEISQIKK